MRMFLILFLASPAIASPWLDGPASIERSPRANIQETSRPRQADTATTSTKAKASTQGCVKCGPLCSCGPNCQCSETAWKESCKAIPPEYRAAWARYYANQATYYQQPYYQPMYGGFGSADGNCAGGS